ncbi:hypothetical protein M9434_001747 [Picochlorum sp. BPE23]|nr:hypothetical protein M9434_001747 [Picochlorum sp. BPE23]
MATRRRTDRVSEIFMYATEMMMVRGSVAVMGSEGRSPCVVVSCSARQRAVKSTRASSSRCVSGATTCERVLRYPDGHERRIRYPCPMAEEMIVGDVQGHVCDLEEEEEEETSVAEASIDVEYRGDVGTWNRTFEDSWDGSSVVGDEVFINKEEEDGLPTQSPLELLRFVMSDAYKEKQKNEYEEVKNSFDICHGCPWPVPKAVYTLAVQDARAAAAARVYAPRTRIFQEGVQSEMTMLLEENRRKNGKVRKTKPVIECSSMVDGVVIFQDESQAMAFGKELEKHVGNTVVLAEHDSHELFRNINETKGVGVVMKRECILPACGKLTTVLRNPTALDG